jgi:hypothetical protein
LERSWKDYCAKREKESKKRRQEDIANSIEENMEDLAIGNN